MRVICSRSEVPSFSKRIFVGLFRRCRRRKRRLRLLFILGRRLVTGFVGVGLGRKLLGCRKACGQENNKKGATTHAFSSTLNRSYSQLGEASRYVLRSDVQQSRKPERGL